MISRPMNRTLRISAGHRPRNRTRARARDRFRFLFEHDHERDPEPEKTTDKPCYRTNVAYIIQSVCQSAGSVAAMSAVVVRQKCFVRQ
jgi:hypothetical protein